MKLDIKFNGKSIPLDISDKCINGKCKKKDIVLVKIFEDRVNSEFLINLSCNSCGFGWGIKIIMGVI